ERFHDLVDIGIAADEFGEAHGQPREQLGRGSRAVLDSFRLLAEYFSAEPVTTLGNGGDPFLATVVRPGLAEGLAKQRHVHADASVLDHQAGPDRSQQLILADQFARSLEQVQEQVERARTEPHRMPVALDPALGFPEGERAEAPTHLAGFYRDVVGRRWGSRRFLGACLHGPGPWSARTPIQPGGGTPDGDLVHAGRRGRRTVTRGKPLQQTQCIRTLICIAARKATLRVRPDAYRQLTLMPRLGPTRRSVRHPDLVRTQNVPAYRLHEAVFGVDQEVRRVHARVRKIVDRACAARPRRDPRLADQRLRVLPGHARQAGHDPWRASAAAVPHRDLA